MKLIKIVLVCVLTFMIVACEKISGDNLRATTPPAPPVLQSISAKLADGKEMLVGKNFDKEKVVVTATYDDGSTQTVASGNWNWQAKNGSFDKTNTTTAQTVKITYGGKETEVSVTVGEYKKFVVVAVAGQSNSVGYDESALNEFDKPLDEYRVFQLGNEEDKDDQAIDDSSVTTWTPKIKPLDYCSVNLQKMRRAVPASIGSRGFAGTKGIHLPLANLLLDHIPDDYAVLVIPCSYGATSVTTQGTSDKTTALWGGDASNGTGKNGNYVWGPKTLSSYILQNRIKWALDQNTENKFAGIVWCQGENDETNVANNKTGFQAMVTQISDFLKNYADRTAKGVMDKSLWFVYESTYHYMAKSGCQQVWANYKDFLGESNYVEVSRAQDIVNTTTYTSSTKQAHFGVDTFRKIIAPAVVAKMQSAGVLWK